MKNAWKARGKTSKNLRNAVRDELSHRRKLGVSFKLPEIAATLDCSRHSISTHSSEYVAELVDELMDVTIDSSEAYESWRRDFETFRYSLQNTARSEEIIRRLLRLTIEDFHRKGEVTFTKVNKVTGRSTSLLREEIKRWEMETGEKAARPKTWRDIVHARAAEGEDCIDKLSDSSRDIIYADFNNRRKIGLPFTTAEVMESTWCGAGTISKYSREYVAAIAEELLNKTVNTTGEYEAWLRDFNTFQHFLRNTRKRKAVLALYIRLAIEDLHRKEIPIGYSEIFRATGSKTQLIHEGIKQWEAATGNKVDKLKIWKTITLPMVLSVVSTELHAMPLTFLESAEMGKAFNEMQLRMIYNINQPKLRNTAFFVMTFADGNRVNDISFFNTMKRYLRELSLTDIDELNPNQFYQKIHDGEILPNEKISVRGNFVQTYFRLLRKQNDYLRKLTPEQKKAFTPFLLHKIEDDHFWQKSTIFREVHTEQKARRKKSTDVIHDKFYLLRDIAERRRTQLSRMRTAYLNAIENHQSTKCELPFAFSITDETVLSSGAVKIVRHHFRLWNAQALRSTHQNNAGDFYERASPYQKSISEKNDLYFLSYEGGHHEDDHNALAPYWFMDLLRVKAFSTEPNLDFQKTHGYSEESILKVPERTDWDVAITWWHERLFRDLGLTFIPPNAFMRNGLIGYASVQIMTKTGARMNEFLQIRLTPEHLRRVKFSEDRETIAFWALPKGRKVEEPYYMDERCMKALHAWWIFQRELGEKFEMVEPTRALKHKLKRAPYLWQHENKHLNHQNVNACMRFMLHGIMLRTAEGNTVNLTSHLLRHGFATELRALGTPIDIIALLMKQRDTGVTEYYSQPTPAKLVELQKRIFENRVDFSREHIRPPAQIKRQIESVRDKVGALIPVIGGTCTVANACPAKFACIGCAGNAPDPAKRSQVIELKRAYGEMVSMAEKQNLPAERRKALDILASCDDVLAEMELIDQAEKAAEEPVILTPKPRPNNEKNN